MDIKDIGNSGLKLVSNKIFGDERGFFTERFRESFFKDAGLPTHFIQENFSRSQVGVLRGLHYQYDKPQGKLITCLSGHILDIAVDIRKDSPTFGKSWSIELTGDKPQWFWIPAGFAHGFCTLGNQTVDILYKVTEYYNPKGENGILWSDPELNIHWPLQNPILSPKDLTLQKFSDYKKSPQF